MSVTAMVRVRKPRTQGSAPHSPTLMTTEAGSRPFLRELGSLSPNLQRWHSALGSDAGVGRGGAVLHLGDTPLSC